MSVGDIWYWDDFHEDREYFTPLTFELSAGSHTLTIANCVYALRLDLGPYVTAAGDEPPGNDNPPCDPPHTIDRGGDCLPSCGLLSGTRCGVVACEGQTPLPAYDCDVCCRVAP